MERSSTSEASPRVEGSVATLLGVPHWGPSFSTARGPSPYARELAPSPPHQPTTRRSSRSRHIASAGMDSIPEDATFNPYSFRPQPHRPHPYATRLHDADSSAPEPPSTRTETFLSGAPSDGGWLTARRTEDTSTSAAASAASGRSRRRAVIEPGPIPPVDRRPVARVERRHRPRTRASSSTTTVSLPPRESRGRKPKAAPKSSLEAAASLPDSGSTTRSRKRKASPSADETKPAAKKRAPGRLKRDPDEEEKAEPTADSNCCICMSEPEPADLATINGCEHMFCFGCIEQWSEKENSCPLCKKRFQKIDRVHKQKRQKGVRGVKNTKKVKNKSQRSEMTHSLALDGLIGELGRSSMAIETIFASLGRSTSLQANIARIVMTGVGGSSGFLELTRSSPPSGPARTRAASTRSAAARAPPAAASMPPSVDDVFFDESDDEDGFNGFIANIRRMDTLRGGGPIFGSFPSSLRREQQAQTPGRSFASNMHVADAGGSADNALEIEDDSDDDDDEVEIVGLAHPRG